MLLALSAAAVLIGASGLGLALISRGTLYTLLAIGLLAWTACVGAVGIAGVVLRELTAGTLTFLAVSWGAGGSLAAWRSGSLSSAGPRLRAALASGLKLAGWPPIAAGLAFVGLSLVWRSILAVRLPVVDVLGWQYHMVIADVWIQAEAIVRVPQNIWTDGWPAGGELLTAWFMTFTHSDNPAGFTGLAPLPVAIVACIGLARELGASRRTAMLAGLLLGMTPAWLALAGTSYPDPGFAAAVVAAWWLGLRLVRGDTTPATCLLFGISGGLALGIKGSGLVLIGPLLAAVGTVLVAGLVRGGRDRRSRWRWLGAGCALLVPLALLGLSWYVRNALLHGNPLYPVGFGPFPGLETGQYGAPPMPEELAAFDGAGRVFRSWIHDWQLLEYPYNVRPGGFGHAWPMGVALAAVGLGVLADRRRIAPLALVVIPMALGIALLYSPWYARYTLFLPAMGWAVAAVALDRFGRAAGGVAGLALVAVAGISVVLANVLPNVPTTLPSTVGERSAAYLRLVVGGSGEERSAIGQRATCGEMERIPSGVRVAVARGYFVPHAAVGSRLQRTLVQPPPMDADTIAGLTAYLQETEAGWLVTRAGTRLDELVSDNPNRFGRRGTTCHGARIWVVRDR